MLRFCMFVVPSTPPPVRNVALLPLFAEIEAVGIPLFTFKKPNFALVVALLPRRKSTTPLYSSFGEIVPFATFQFVPPLPTHEPQLGTPDPFDLRHSPSFPAAV